jgi:1-pyrroline-5-carboxylate dehydrogenase
MATAFQIPKITYTTMSLDQMAAFNEEFDQALDVVRRNKLGQAHGLWIGGHEVRSSTSSVDYCPHDRRIALGTFDQATGAHAEEAIATARKASVAWSSQPYADRVHILRAAAENFRVNRFEIGAILSMEAGKPRLESIGEVDEAADLIDTYCDQVVEHDGYVLKLKALDVGEHNRSILRPYGVFAVIAPFNFPIALTTGMIAGALVAGNTVVYKPSDDTPYSAHYVYEMFASAGMPPGTMNLLTGRGSVVGVALVSSPRVDGVAFIGSKEVGFQILKQGLLNYPRPCIAEMGGKNPVIVMSTADLDKAVIGTGRAAFGYSGQKCSAASRVYVHEDVYEEFVSKLVSYASTLKVGDPTRADTFMGPVINQDAFERFASASATAFRDGNVLLGGHAMTHDDLDQGYFVEQTIVDGVPHNHPFFRDELFLPFLVIGKVTSLDEALDFANASEFGLTAGIFTEDEDEQKRFLDQMQAGVLYVNRKGGATTGAWPGVQSFGGWKASGSTGKSALGPYYVSQFMHEQSQTILD